MTATSGTEDSTFTFAFVPLACAVSAMLCEMVGSGVSSRVRRGHADEAEVKGDLDFDVVLCQSELTDRTLQLCLLLPPGFQPVSLHSYHTQPRATLCVLFNGCLMELNSHPSCSGPPISARELSNCVCARLSVCVSTWCPPSDSLPGFGIRARVTLSSSASHLSFQHFLFLVSAVCSYISQPEFGLNIYDCSSPTLSLSRRPFRSSSCLLSALSLWHASCSLSAVFSHLWFAGCVGSSKLTSLAGFIYLSLSAALSVISELRHGCCRQFGALRDSGHRRRKIPFPSWNTA